MKHTIQVTQHHINRGQPRDCSLCPVALAIADHFNNPAIHARVSPIMLGFRINDYFFNSCSPDSVWEFIVKFDKPLKDESPQPFSFDIDLPDQFQIMP